MRRRPIFVLGALAFAGAAVASGANAQIPEDDPEPTTTTRQPTTTSPPMTVNPSSTTTSEPPAPGPRSTTTVRGRTTTTAPPARGPVPPPASGVSQPLDPSLLGGVPMQLPATTTTGVFSTEDDLPTTTILSEDNAITVAQSSNGPSGATLALASLAWLAALGGLLVYAEDQRSKQWRHLAR